MFALFKPGRYSATACYIICYYMYTKLTKRQNESLTYRKNILHYFIVLFTHIVCMMEAFTIYQSFLNKITAFYVVIYVTEANYPLRTVIVTNSPES